MGCSSSKVDAEYPAKNAPHQAPVEALSTYLSEDSLRELMAGDVPPVRVLDGEWLLNRAEQARRAADKSAHALPRRQALETSEPSAFMQADVLFSLPRGDRFVGSPLPLICVSHAWLTKEHPDPQCANMVALADAIREQQAHEDPDQRLPSKFAVMMDWVSLPQKDANGERTKEELAAFHTALSSMQLW